MTYACVFYRTHRLLSTDLDTGNDTIFNIATYQLVTGSESGPP
jgi:hypothetical protein